MGENNHRLLSSNGKEAVQIMDFLTRLDSLISDLGRVKVFIRRFPVKEYYESNDIDQLDFIKYHFEVFIHKIHTILEVKKLWLNDFYKIGLKEKDCTWDKLKVHSAIQKSPTKLIIESYYKSFQQIITVRHLNTHRAFYNDKKNDDLKSYLMKYNSFKKFGLDDYESIQPKVLIDYQIKEYRKKKFKYVENGTEIAEAFTIDFITIIPSEFLEKKK
ncbi:Cthe_2314 family HEPN domain-containing protein [Fulvivirgaceae bacterium LMO-SS25]